jgi:TetR/AcrR family transcriptional repressor of nem operon
MRRSGVRAPLPPPSRPPGAPRSVEDQLDDPIRPVYCVAKLIVKTKERILDAAKDLILTKSFHSVGLAEILAAVNVPKGSFYHHFNSKEQFGVELIAHYVQEHTAELRKFFAAPGTNALQKLVEYWNYQVGYATAGACRQGCLVVKLGLEVASFSEPMRAVLADGLKTWRAIFEEVVRAGQADGSIRRALNPAETAAAIQDHWQGAMQRMQVEKDVAPLRAAARFLRASLAAD